MEDKTNNVSRISSFEDNLKEAKDILEKLIDPEITLSKSIEYYKVGLEKLKTAQELLEKAKLEFKEIENESKSDDEIPF